jgi:hypothetical protein
MGAPARFSDLATAPDAEQMGLAVKAVGYKAISHLQVI